ncbi:hypothetical protein AA0119_g11517 [Alternaria tenuissima]|uniref:Uncharacterized protein n=2 Tax=Alternaria alternata complex TaxID=187734 RepID=A0A4Q4N109_ALTAL|nr:hypothetical protein AA0117_g12271 [Alternaria alternata]RYN89238.1 hypothetical protein AA0119_g11517 [Alternaria tenuissima]RYO04894.1 hypothetical protein AA0121_g12610 [Alternaria tenuissima]RYO48023.1 hypothetical protein AA0116_g12792 [Alternaria tenuissima]
MQAIRAPTTFPSSTAKDRAGFTKLPREIRDAIYSFVIDASESLAYNDCGIGITYPPVSALLLCKQIASEFTSALIRETRVALRIDLNKSSILDSVNSVRKGFRTQAYALAINVREKARTPLFEENAIDFDRQQVADAIADAVQAFPRVRDVAIDVKLRNTASEELVGLLQERLEQNAMLEEYRIYTHVYPSFRAHLESRDSWHGRSTLTWRQLVLYEEKRQWKARVIADGQWSTQRPVWLVFGENHQTCAEHLTLESMVDSAVAAGNDILE